MTFSDANAMTKPSVLWTGIVLVALLGACGGSEAGDPGAEGDPRAVLIEACETQQGIGWLKRE